MDAYNKMSHSEAKVCNLTSANKVTRSSGRQHTGLPGIKNEIIKLIPEAISTDRAG